MLFCVNFHFECISEVKLTFEMLTACGEQHSFSTRERMFLWKCHNFWDRNFSTWGGLEPPTYGFMPNALTIWAIICCPMFFNTGPDGINMFKLKLSFEMLTERGQKHSLSTHERMFLWKWQRFWDRKCIDLRGTRTPSLWIHAECSNHSSYQGQTFAVPWFLILALTVYIFVK